ncbi:MAG: nitroreductase family protein [Sphingomonadaceae bacterium]
MSDWKRIARPAWARQIGRLVRGFARWPRAIAAYAYDMRRFAAASGAIWGDRAAPTLEARLVKEYHRIEKGLAMPEPRMGFGQRLIAEVQRLVTVNEEAAGPTFHSAGARSALLAYRGATTCLPETATSIAEFEAARPAASMPEAGMRWESRDAVRQASAIDFAAFARSRSSVRDFSGEPVPEAIIRESVAIAMKSPRVCNRGTARCHAIFDPDLKARALALQNGNTGFGHLAGAVLVITSDRRGFHDLGERNQCWVDGGLFAMTLCHALHAAGYGTCMLNWSVLPDKDRALHRLLAIPEEEAIITLMAVGGLKERYRVAVSPREPVETAFRVVKASGRA